VRDEPDDDELADGMPLELRSRSVLATRWSTNALGHNITWLRFELGAQLAAPRAVLERLAVPAAR
jgi:hypothetical protein